MKLTFSEIERNRKISSGLFFVLVAILAGLWSSEVLNTQNEIAVTIVIVLAFIYSWYKLLFYPPYNKTLIITSEGLNVIYRNGERSCYKQSIIKVIQVRRRPLMSSVLRSSKILRVHLKSNGVLDFSLMYFSKDDMSHISKWNYPTKMY